jgi:hypothetical protein
MRNPSHPGLIYSGKRDRAGFAIVRVDETVLSPKQAAAIYAGAPDGFEWGYDGSGPRLLALALLYDYLADADQALSYCAGFFREVVGKFAREKDWSLSGEEIEAALARIAPGELPPRPLAISRPRIIG